MRKTPLNRKSWMKRGSGLKRRRPQEDGKPAPYHRLIKKKPFSQLKQRKPMAKKSPKRKGVISKVSPQKKKLLAEYRRLKDSDPAMICCPCGNCKNPLLKEMLEPHHPFGRIGKRLLIYVWICPSLHEWIHSHGKEARELGMLMPEFDGRKSNKLTPDFFKIRSTVS